MYTEEDYDHLIKIVLIGDSGVGKTNLSGRYTKDYFSSDTKNTIGVDFSSKDLSIDGKSVKVQFWDTAGQEKYRALASTYYKNLSAAVLVYDITSKKSFDNVEIWYNELSQYLEDNIKILLIGNKSDLEDSRDVPTELAERYAKEKDFFFMETSALTNKDNCVNKAFEILIKEVVKLKEKEEINKTEEEINNWKKRTLTINTIPKIKGDNLSRTPENKKGGCSC